MSHVPRAGLTRLAASLALAAALLLPAAAPLAAADGDGPVVLRIGTDQDLETLNPWHSVTVADYEIFQIQYDMLVSFDENLDAAPGFAESWSSSEDGQTHTFTIRDGMTWSDGEPATCEDARWTYQFVLDAVASEAGYVGSGYLEPYLTNAGLETVTCENDTTLVVTTSFPTTLLTQAYVPILPKHIWSEYTMDQIGNAEAEGFFVNEPPVVGTGPYVTVEWEPGQFIRLARNESYWGQAGYPDEIIFQKFDGSDTMVQALRSGELDYIVGVGADQFDALANQPDIQTVEGFSNGYTYLSFNTKGNSEGYNGSTSALSDPAFRDALGYALDLERLVDATLAGHGVVGTTQVPPYHVDWHVPPAEPRTFDLEEANRRLDAAGYTRNDNGNRVDKDGKEIVLRLTWPDSEEEQATNAQFIQGWWKELGITVDAFVTEEGKLLDDLLGPGADGTADWDTYIWGWVGDPDPMSLLSFFTTEQYDNLNDSFWTNERYDELFALQQRATDTAERKAYITEMQELFYENAPYHVLYYDSTLHAYRTDKFGGWTRQPPDSGTPLIGYGYPGYLALTAAGEEPSAPPSEAPATTDPGESAAPATAAPAASPAPSGGAAGGGDNTTLLLLVVVGLVVLVVAAGFLMARRRRPGTELDE